MMLTSSQRTQPARLPLFFLLFLNVVIERLICSLYTKFSEEFETHSLYSNLYSFVWYSRYGFTFLGAVLILYIALTYRDVLEQNLYILNAIKQQNDDILKSMGNFRRSKTPLTSSTSIDFIAEQTNAIKNDLESSIDRNRRKISYDRECSIDCGDVSTNGFHSSYARKKNFEFQNKKYQLRSQSRQGTPDSGVVH